MKTVSSIKIVLAMSFLVLAATESVAAAAACDDLEAPAECSSGRNLNGYVAGIATGKSLVLQIWASAAVAQNKDNWNVLKQQVTDTIPKQVSSAIRTSPTEYTTCRMQGLLEGTVCQMNSIMDTTTELTANASMLSATSARGSGCQLDGADWGKISSAIYCSLSIDLGGLADVKPWFIRFPFNMCALNFQFYCDETYRYGATYGGDPLVPEVRRFVESQGLPVQSFLQTPECVQYTKAPYATVFRDSVYIDCSYYVPEQ